MKIKFSDNTLNPNGESPKNIIVETRRFSQVEFPINAENAKLFDRKNAKTSVSFTVEQAHLSECEALIFATTHASELSKSAPAELSFISTNTDMNVKFQNTSPSRIKIENDGIMTISTYEFSTETPNR